ncbi:MAG: ATP-dependent acyl-CoA ligase [Solirubrobacterales bacterium]|jgi:crotonobetaine/carnitine-CoA ligase|nr:ATP-dependent acyl-CoA ligase [Solirubrobacterales bacterium]
MDRLEDVLAEAAAAAPTQEFLTFCAADGREETITYGAFHEQVRRLAAGLRAVGVDRGQRCLLFLPNSVGFMLGFWAAHEAGAIAVPTVASASADELRYVCKHCEPAVIITDQAGLATAREALSGRPTPIVLTEDGAGESADATIAQLIAGFEPLERDGAASDEDPAVLLYTSGTTSRPKGALLSHRGCRYTGESFAQHLRLRPQDRTLICLPLFHVNGMLLQMLPVVLSRGTMVLAHRFSVSSYWGWVARHEITMAHLVAGPVRLLLASEAGPAPQEHAVRAMTFGLPLTGEEIEAFETRFGVPLTMAWGLTESGAAGTLMPLYAGRRPGHQAIGRPMLGWDVRVVAQDGEELADGETGELVIRSPGVMLGYHRDAEATAAALRDGWLHSGDLGYRDEHGYLHFVDRVKDMIKPSGENVAASEVERVLLTHPDVAECAVIGVPDPIRSEAVKALVVRRDGSTLETDELRAFCGEHLAPFKVPSIVEFRPALPKTAIGKVNKGALRTEQAAR